MLERTISRLEFLKSLRNADMALEMLGAESDRRCPKDTGNLVASRHNFKTSDEFGLEYLAEYGIYVHEDLSKKHTVGEAKFLERAYESKKKKFLEILLGEP